MTSECGWNLESGIKQTIEPHTKSQETLLAADVQAGYFLQAVLLDHHHMSCITRPSFIEREGMDAPRTYSLFMA